MDPVEFEMRLASSCSNLSLSPDLFGTNLWPRVGPSMTDIQLSAIADLYWDSTPMQRECVGQALDCGKNTWALVAFVRRISKFVSKESANLWLRRGLAIAALEGCRFDYRDLIVSLVLLRHAVEDACGPTRPMFDEAIAMFGEGVRGVFENARDHTPGTVDDIVAAFGPDSCAPSDAT